MALDDTLNRYIDRNQYAEIKAWIGKLLQHSQLVGDLFSMNYEKARVIIHDTFRHKVGGIPNNGMIKAIWT